MHIKHLQFCVIRNTVMKRGHFNRKVSFMMAFHQSHGHCCRLSEPLSKITWLHLLLILKRREGEMMWTAHRISERWSSGCGLWLVLWLPRVRSMTWRVKEFNLDLHEWVIEVPRISTTISLFFFWRVSALRKARGQLGGKRYQLFYSSTYDMMSGS